MNSILKIKFRPIKCKLFIGLVMLLFSFGSINAQSNIVVSGKVTNAKGDALPFVNVLIKGQVQGTSTDDDGGYTITVPNEKTVLQFSFVGFLNKEVTVGSQTIINVSLEAESSELDEIVIVGYAATKRESLTGSLTLVKADKLLDATTPSVSNMLAGKAAGVLVTQSSGQPGSTSDIVIRGKSSLGDNTAPLWVIDGVIVGNSPYEINPSDVESMTILKDAASTAIYGSSGSNGVVLVTTKRAKTGQATVNFSAKFGFNKLNKGNLEFMNSAELYDHFSSMGAPNLKSEYATTYYDWFGESEQVGKTQDYNVSISGGTDKFKVYTSLGYYDESGAVKGYDYNRMNGRANIEYNPYSWLTIRPSVSASLKKTDDRQHSLGGMYTNVPWDLPYSPTDGHLISHKEIRDSWYGKNRSNYLYPLQWNFTEDRRHETQLGFDGDIKFTDYLTFTSTNNYKYFDRKMRTYSDPRTSGGEADKGLLREYRSDYYRVFTNQLLRFTKTFDKHFLTALVSFEFNEHNEDFLDAYKAGVPSNFESASVGTTNKGLTGFRSGWATQSVLSRVDYSYDNRYIAQASFRRDGSSRFGADHKYGNFYSISGGWNIHNESFFKIKQINQLKLRASYGLAGSIPGNRAGTAEADLPNGYYPQYGIYSLNTSYNGVTAMIYNQLSNKDLTWEKNHTIDIGLDIRLFNRVTIELDYYNKRTTDLLLRAAQPSISGVDFRMENIGEIQNYGFDALISADIIRTNKVVWNAELNLNFNKNKIKKLYGGSDVIQSSGLSLAGVLNKLWREGESVDTWYGKDWAGVDPDNGDPLWYRTDPATGQLTTTSTYAQGDDRIVGCASPDLIGGFNTRVSYMGLNLSVTTNFVLGGDIYNYNRTEFDSDGAYTDRNQQKLYKDWSRWQKQGDIATHPKAVAGNKTNSHVASSRFLENGSYFRLRNITLSYDIPKDLTKYFGMQVFVAGENLWTWTKYSGLDPEVGPHGAAYANYPITRRFTFGLNINF